MHAFFFVSGMNCITAVIFKVIVNYIYFVSCNCSHQVSKLHLFNRLLNKLVIFSVSYHREFN